MERPVRCKRGLRPGVGLVALGCLVAGLLVSVATGASPAAASPAATWTQLSPSTSPPPLYGPSMAFDPVTGQLLLTGFAPGDVVNETWTWNGTTWKQLNPATSPPAREYAAMAWDASTGQLVLFGGLATGTSSFINDTWTWDGSTWTNVTPSSPSASPPIRELASMAYDPYSGEFVLYAGLGTSNAYLDDTWTWNGTAWSNVTPTGYGPTARAGAAMAYDPVSNRLIVFSGFSASNNGNGYDDTWAWEGSAWQQLTVLSDPGALGGGSMVDDPAVGQLVLFGGQRDGSGGNLLGFTEDWNGSAFDGLSPTASPSAREYLAMAYDPNTSQLLLFGGYNGSAFLNDTWTYGAPPPASSCTPFTDNFQATSLSSNWETNTPLLAAVASDVGAVDEQAQLLIGEGGMDMQGAAAPNQFTGIQSVASCSGPFSFETNVEGLAANGNAFVIYLVSADQSRAFSVEGNLNSNNQPYYGVWASNGLGAAFGAGQDIDASPSIDTVYDVKMSVDGSGNGTVTLNGPGLPGTPISVGSVGAGPFSVVLGQREGQPNTPGANEAVWSNAVLSQGASVTASLSTTSPTVAGVETVPASAVPASSVAGAPATVPSDAASAPLSSIPLHSIGLASSPLSSIPLSSIPLSSIALSGSGTPPSGVAAAQQALASTLLSDLSITYPPNCGAAPAPACTGWQGVLAGTSFAGVPLESVTLADVLQNPTASANFNLVNLGALDLASSPLSSIPLSSIELGAAPLSSIGLGGAGAGADALSAWCVELTKIGSNCTSFGIGPNDSSTNVTLLSLALAGVPLSSIPLSSIPLSSIPLSSIPLSSIPLSSINLASNPLSSIPLSSIPLSSIPLSSIPLSSIPLSSIPLSSIPLSSIPLSSKPLSSIPLSSIPLSSIPLILNCPSFASLCAPGSSTTLGAALAAGAILPTATLGELGTYGTTTLGQLGTYGTTTIGELPASALAGTTVGQLLVGDTTTASGYPNLNVGDLLLSTVPPASYHWQAVNLAGLPLAADATAGGTAGTVSYVATFTVQNAPASVQVALTLPPTFAYVPGTTKLDGAAAPDPTTGSSLVWTPAPLVVGTHLLTFQATAGIGLGPAAATLSVSSAGTVVSSSAATVDVVDGEQPQINAAGTAFPLTPGTLNTSPTTQGNLNIGYITSQGDLNDWAVNVAQGAELSLALTNLPATYDLELFGPSNQQLQGSPTQGLSGVTDTLPTITPGTTTEATPGSQDLPVTPPPGDQLEAVSNNSGGQSQYIQTAPLSAGTYIVQVSGYNGAFSSQPYLLQANVLGGASAPSCPAGISYLSALPSPATGPVAIPNGVNTLFLVDTQRLAAAFPQQAGQIMTQLQTVASDATAGVDGAVIPVDAYASVQNAYAAWNTDPCSVPAANAVVAAIASVVDQIRADNPTVQNLVIVGADDQIPFARIADGATQSNERDYGATTFAGQNNVEAAALSLGYYLSDDPYAAGAPLGVGSATLYLPQLAEGRLVESAAEIESALNRFVQTGGDLNASASLTTGYSFLSSGAQAVSANLAGDNLAPSTLITESWQESDLDAKLAASPTPGVDSLNAHFDYSRALPAYDNANNVQTNLFTTADVRNPPVATSYAGRLLFSMGCHAGLGIDDAEVAASGVSSTVDDWTKTFADAGALWVANTGYGYADTDTVAYSAKLMAEFAGNLNGSLTIGAALAGAKQQYAAGNAILSPYDLKALMESTFYGLPMYHLNGAATPVTPPSGPPTVSNPIPGISGLSAAPVSLSLGQGGGTSAGQLSLITTANGSYYQVNGTNAYNPGTQTTEYRPIEPLATVPATEPNLVPHGAVVTALQSTDTPGFRPVYSMPAVGSANATPPSIGDAAFPGTLQRVATYGAFTANGTSQGTQLDLVAGQFFPNPLTPGRGTQRIFNSMSAQVLYVAPNSPLANDYTPATIDSSQAITSPSGLNFVVQVTPSSANDQVGEVLALYTDATNPGTWTSVALTPAAGGLSWSGSALSTPSHNTQYIIEAVDTAGNVAVSNNEGADFNGTTQPSLSIFLSGSSVANGYYTGPVSAAITAPSGSTYVLDGSLPAAVPATAVVVSGNGEHTITVTDPSGDVATQAFAISTAQTTITVSANADPSVVGQAVTFTATVTPSTVGAGTPTGKVEFLDGSTPIVACGGSAGAVIGTAGAACAVTYTSPGSHQISAEYLGDSNFAVSRTSLPLAQAVNQAGSATALSSSANPSTVGQPVIFTATVAPSSPGTGTPTGFVEFLDGPTPIAGCGGASGVLIGATGAICAVSYTSPGSHTVTATYLGDANFNGPATSAPIRQTVNPGATTTTLSSSTNPSVVGQPVTLTARVTVVSPGAGTPTGHVELVDGTAPIASCGGAAGVPVSSTGVAVCTASFTSGATHRITATYLGDANFKTSATSTALAQTVDNQTATTLSSSHNPSAVRSSVTITATVKVLSPGTGIPSGYVEFLNGTTPIAACGGATGQLISGTGTATCAQTYATAGAQNLVAIYRGGGFFLASTSATLSQIVTPFACSSLSGCNLSGLNLAGANLQGANLSGSNLAGANLQGANLAGANLTGANLSGANLSGANLGGAILIGANLAGAIATGANLTGANATGANLAGDSLQQANLTNTNFTNANLATANLHGANLTGTIFTGANLTGTKFCH